MTYKCIIPMHLNVWRWVTYALPCHRMRITEEELREFISICEEEYGVQLSPGEAMVCAKRLLLLYELIYRPLPSEREPGLTVPRRTVS